MKLYLLHDIQEDVENRACWDNQRAWSLPESNTDLQGMITSFLQELASDIPPEHLEFD